MKLKLDGLKIHSFVTSLEKDQTREVKGGESLPCGPRHKDVDGGGTFGGTLSFPLNCTESYDGWCTAVGGCVDPMTSHCP